MLLLKLSVQSSLSGSIGQIIGGIIGFFIVVINFKFIRLAIAVANLLMFFVAWKYMEERNFIPESVEHHYLRKIWVKLRESFSYVFHQDSVVLRILMLANIMGIVSTSALLTTVPLLFTQVLGLKVEYLPMLFSSLAILNLIVPLVARKIAIYKDLNVCLF